MLNYKVKNHYGLSSTNRTDSLCIIECYDHITRAYATIIPDKNEETLVPIICGRVANESIIWTDEHKSYFNLSNFSFCHGTVCHKFEFMSFETGINMQANESFHIELKLNIKRRRRVLTGKEKIF